LFILRYVINDFTSWLGREGEEACKDPRWIYIYDPLRKRITKQKPKHIREKRREFLISYFILRTFQRRMLF